MVGAPMSMGAGAGIGILVNAGFGTTRRRCIGVVRSNWRWDRHLDLRGSTHHEDFDRGGIGGQCGRDLGRWW